AREAVRLGRALHGLLPDDGEVAGLLALMLLTDVRRAARTGPDEGLIPLDGHAQIAGHHRLPAVRAHLLEMAGNPQAAIEHYRIAADRAASLPERNYLIMQAARLGETTPCTDGKIQDANE